MDSGFMDSGLAGVLTVIIGSFISFIIRPRWKDYRDSRNRDREESRRRRLARYRSEYGPHMISGFLDGMQARLDELQDAELLTTPDVEPASDDIAVSYYNGSGVDRRLVQLTNAALEGYRGMLNWETNHRQGYSIFGSSDDHYISTLSWRSPSGITTSWEFRTINNPGPDRLEAMCMERWLANVRNRGERQTRAAAERVDRIERIRSHVDRIEHRGGNANTFIIYATNGRRFNTSYIDIDRDQAVEAALFENEREIMLEYSEEEEANFVRVGDTRNMTVETTTTDGTTISNVTEEFIVRDIQYQPEEAVGTAIYDSSSGMRIQTSIPIENIHPDHRQPQQVNNGMSFTNNGGMSFTETTAFESGATNMRGDFTPLGGWNDTIQASRSRIEGYHRTKRNTRDLSDGAEITVGYEIEKTSFNTGRLLSVARHSGDRVGELELFRGYETDSSCGVEAITNILPLSSDPESLSRVKSMFDDASHIINSSYNDSCGGHINISCTRFTNSTELLRRMKPCAGLLLAMFRKRLKKSACNANMRLNLNSASRGVLAAKGGGLVEFRLPPAVENVEDLYNRHKFMAIYMEHAISSDYEDMDLLINKLDGLLEKLCGSKTQKVLELAPLFQNWINGEDASESIRTWTNTSNSHQSLSGLIYESSGSWTVTPRHTSANPHDRRRSGNNDPYRFRRIRY